MKVTSKDINILRVAVVPAFILSTIVGGIATLSMSISEAVTADSSIRDRERAVIERALEGRELAVNQRGAIRYP